MKQSLSKRIIRKQWIKKISNDVKSEKNKIIISVTSEENNKEISANFESFIEISENGCDHAATMIATIIFKLRLKLAKSYGLEGLEKAKFFEELLVSDPESFIVQP